MTPAARLPPIEEATSSYEAWLEAQTPVVASDLKVKHRKMSKDPFAFLRGTFYRWAQLWPIECRDDLDAPRIPAIGDLHTENFGTWRDWDGRLVWGTNDFDEACLLPYTNDLTRLATSAWLAIKTQHLSIPRRKAIATILDGYASSLAQGGRPFVLEGEHRDLRKLALRELGDPSTFWPKIEAPPIIRDPLPKGARKALEATLPTPTPGYDVRHRTAGVGSLGRQRFVATARVGGAPVAREAKARIPPATAWAEMREATATPGLPLQAVRMADPFFQIRRRWVVRRLSPDCDKISLGALLDEQEQKLLLYAMGWETGNVHLGSGRGSALRRDLERRGGNWLFDATERMAAATLADWSRWTETG
jgi:uncharacterized protein DUF2252